MNVEAKLFGVRTVVIAMPSAPQRRVREIVLLLVQQGYKVEIIPAIDAAKSKGIFVDGPFPPDTIFPKMKGGQYDVVVCMYHDQGHIPTKLLGFNYNHEKKVWEGLSGVNLTLGLPIIRVSVDHGVAFDKGGKGEANPQSMIQAIQYGARLCS